MSRKEDLARKACHLRHSRYIIIEGITQIEKGAFGMKKWLIVLLSPLLPFCLFSQSKPIIAVLDFKTDGVSEKEMRTLIARFTTALFNTEKFTVIDIGQRESLLREMEFSVSGCTDEACQLKIGKMLSAEMIVVGNIGKIGSRFLISSKMLETETARTRSAVDGVYSSLDLMVDDLPNLSAKLAGITQRVAPLFNWKIQGGIVSLIAGIGSMGAGGYFLYDVATNGKTAIDSARSEYEQASEADAEAKWNALNATVEGTKARLYWGIGLSAAGILLSGLGVVLFTMPAGTSVVVDVRPQGRTVLLSAVIHY